ncbi:30S ribosomal protein S16 [Candidatus Gottesmanbacteria bacterium RIFCSPHIGHO2_01_FULL_42_12]|uniref:Small ribosomal subunit protein bS16 n=1 Tax=Candidatus Gottesmanbacteria bacterium RIFCSPHIGHO2_01_FULL_42_12 TaxID=1798377 RepID=A0A1F5Z1Q4_9BACT|nr:MAG: 30S ribosomal protein S16 [Candidatus Gottesmanbacteria bacterium RIFCSPHIGHO2_01_FULL_42_12]
MAVKIRLARYGTTGKPAYRVVAIDEQKKRNGKAIEFLGSHEPVLNPPKTILKIDRIRYWLSVGAKPSPTVATLIKKNS